MAKRKTWKVLDYRNKRNIFYNLLYKPFWTLLGQKFGRKKELTPFLSCKGQDTKSIITLGPKMTILHLIESISFQKSFVPRDLHWKIYYYAIFFGFQNLKITFKHYKQHYYCIYSLIPKTIGVVQLEN